MLSPEDNAVLTQVGPNTPLGRMMRRYWHPIALSTQVPIPDGAPYRAKLLSEQFVVFRDTAGNVGVLDEECPHRGVSLALGRNEFGGLRCLYHGWKFSVDGTILETPNHADCRLRERVKAVAYPVREQSGIVWTYIGPKEKCPPFRTFRYDKVPPTHRVVVRSNCKASWLPLCEGGVDSAHVGVLHTNIARPAWAVKTSGKVDNVSVAFENIDDLAPSYEVENTEFGFHYCAFRQSSGGGSQHKNVRIVPSALPYVRIIPVPGGDFEIAAFEVPLDDFETATYLITYSDKKTMDRGEIMKFNGYLPPLYDEQTCDFELDWSNRLGQDRSLMGANWTGYNGVELEDFAMSVSLGKGWNRSREHLVASDLAVIRLRHRVLEAVRLNESGKDPFGVSQADMSILTACDKNIGPDEKWRDLVPEHRCLNPAASD